MVKVLAASRSAVCITHAIVGIVSELLYVYRHNNMRSVAFFEISLLDAGGTLVARASQVRRPRRPINITLCKNLLDSRETHNFASLHRLQR
eukprot:SAG11_NODE_1403_length_5007_cov_3.825591_4_plen_91_part_00